MWETGVCPRFSFAPEIPCLHQRDLRRIDVLAQRRRHLLRLERHDAILEAPAEGEGATEIEVSGPRACKRAVLRAILRPGLQDAGFRVGELRVGEAILERP